MAQYINKAALVAEIERRINRNNEKVSFYPSGSESDCICRVKEAVYEDLISFLDTLESKEVDLEKEVIDWWNAHYSTKDYPFEGHAGHYLENSTVIEIAKHFFEFGLKVKGE